MCCWLAMVPILRFRTRSTCPGPAPLALCLQVVPEPPGHRQTGCLESWFIRLEGHSFSNEPLSSFFVNNDIVSFLQAGAKVSGGLSVPGV